MVPEKDYLTIVIGVIGLASIGLALKLNLNNPQGAFFYALLVVQGIVMLYLIYVVVSRAREAWTDYRWRPDRLR